MTPPRAYVSPLRAAQAAATRRRILETAAELFARDGYAATSLAKLAEEAGVSLETVKANGPKSSIILAAFDQAFTGEVGDADAAPIHQRDVGSHLLEVADELFLRAWVEFVTGANERISRLWIALLDASMGDPAVAEGLESLQERRRSDYRASIAEFRARGLAQREADDEQLAASLLFLASPSGYVQLVLDAGWTLEQYRDWLVDTIERTIFAP